MLRAFFLFLAVLVAAPLCAQDLTVATVTRVPFSFVSEGEQTGFSIALWTALTEELGRGTDIVRVDTFPEMLALVEQGRVDAAIANISVTSGREAVMDFTQPIYASGLQIMIPAEGQSLSLLGALFSRDIALILLAATVILFGGGMMMWTFERGLQPYFDRTRGEALFPSFWWALNLVVNGGFEERVPRSVGGRIFGVILVFSSLFVVSAFVAKITTAMTVDAIRSSVEDVNDLYGKSVGTTSGSTAAAFLDRRDIDYRGYDTFVGLIDDFEAGRLDAVVFDAPILAHYASHAGHGIGELTGNVFLRENYAIALPAGSPLAEEINLALLRLREDGTYARLHLDWFGQSEE